jgi:hypothetical protein
MNTLTIPVLIKSITTLLTEAYAGPPDPRATWFIDTEPDSGILGILASVTAEEASASVDGSGETGSTIASHAEHLRWSLAQSNAAIRGEPFEGNGRRAAINPGRSVNGTVARRLRAEFETLRQG